MIEETWPGGNRLLLKVGLDSGEVLATAYGYFGHAVNRCVALCSRASGGQTLVSEVTRGLLRDQDLGGLALVDIGERELGGSAIGVYEIRAGAPKA